MDFDLNQLPDAGKAAINGIPFLAGAVKEIETPYYTKLLQAVITFMVVGLIGWASTVVITNKNTGEQVLSQLTLLNAQIDFMRETVTENKAEIRILKSATKDRVYRPEWQQKYREQDARLLHLERSVVNHR